MSPQKNLLSNETSPYLLQHAGNPVNWYPWGDEAFEKAKQEQKLVLISIGYSSCHWCHVMEREAFSDPEVAEFMNTHYINIKVDREERPDVDQIYMNAVQIISRSGGWPLNCFALPDGRPVYGGTYFPSDAWLDILKSLHFTWMSEPKRIEQVADELLEGISQTEIITHREASLPSYTRTLETLIAHWERHFDLRHGGLKGKPKFAMPEALTFLLEYSWATEQTKIADYVELTLHKMARSGLYDQLGGGFFRYSVDEMWHVPHFEKMLYDNALLIKLYSLGYKHFKNSYFADIVFQSVAFLKNELLASNGGFYSAIDADSEGLEGKYYTFKKEEADKLTGEDAELFSILFGISASGNIDGRNALRLASTPKEAACIFRTDEEVISTKKEVLKEKAFQYRNRRIRPETDDKQILSWNALAIRGLIEAYLVFDHKEFLDLALGAIDFIEQNLLKSNGYCQRVFCKGHVHIEAFLDDYAYLIDAYISLYTATFNEEWLTKAKSITQYTIEHFYCNDSGMFFYTHAQHSETIVRKMELVDGVLPSSGAVMAQNLQTLGVYFPDTIYTELSKQMAANIGSQVEHGGPFIYKWAELLLFQELGSATIKTKGEEGKMQLREILKENLRPHAIPFLEQENSILFHTQPTITHGILQVCIGTHCTMPTLEAEEALETLAKERL